MMPPTATATSTGKATRSALARRRGEGRALVMAHRGTAGATVPENTARACQAAVLSGADIVEIDVLESTDGVFFAFHDGQEPSRLGRDIDLRELHSTEIATLPFAGIIAPATPAVVETLDSVLTGLWDRFPDALVNLDRSWPYWPQLLPFLDGYHDPERLILKSPVADRDWRRLQQHEVKYPYIGICRTVNDVDEMIAALDLNVVGLELIASDELSPFYDPGYLRELQGRGLVLLANAEIVGSDNLFAGHDDDESLFGSSTGGWNRLLDLGFDIIQTDWPWLLRRAITAKWRGGRDAGDAEAPPCSCR